MWNGPSAGSRLASISSSPAASDRRCPPLSARPWWSSPEVRARARPPSSVGSPRSANARSCCCRWPRPPGAPPNACRRQQGCRPERCTGCWSSIPGRTGSIVAESCPSRLMSWWSTRSPCSTWTSPPTSSMPRHRVAGSCWWATPISFPRWARATCSQTSFAPARSRWCRGGRRARAAGPPGPPRPWPCAGGWSTCLPRW